MKILCAETDPQVAPFFSWIFPESEIDIVSPHIYEQNLFAPGAKIVSHSTFESVSGPFDIAFIIVDPIKLVDVKMFRSWVGQPGGLQILHAGYTLEDHRAVISKLLRSLQGFSIHKMVIVDTDDRALGSAESLRWIEQQASHKVHRVLKREYRRTHQYSYSAGQFSPFPYITFAFPRCASLYIKPNLAHDSEIHRRSSECVWAGAAHYRLALGMRDEWVNRKDMLNGIRVLEPLVESYGQEQSEYLATIRKYQYCLHLNGTGHLCHRFFEGISQGSLLLMQEHDVVFPFPHFLHPLCIFEDPEGFAVNLGILRKDSSAFDMAYHQQQHIVQEYLSPQGIRRYLDQLL